MNNKISDMKEKYWLSDVRRNDLKIVIDLFWQNFYDNAYECLYDNDDILYVK